MLYQKQNVVFHAFLYFLFYFSFDEKFLTTFLMKAHKKLTYREKQILINLTRILIPISFVKVYLIQRNIF